MLRKWSLTIGHSGAVIAPLSEQRSDEAKEEDMKRTPGAALCLSGGCQRFGAQHEALFGNTPRKGRGAMRVTVAVGSVVAVGVLLAGRALAGSLDPTNAPGPTMHTLEEIYQKLDAIVSHQSAALPKTGQTTVYQAGDDGDYQKGVAWSSPRFTVQTDTNCVRDNLTGLVWARNADLAGSMAWSNALVYCEGLSYGGQNDWRLPNVREIQSLMDYGRSHPPICNTAGTGQWTANDPFTGVVLTNNYWSSSTYFSQTVSAWFVDPRVGWVGGQYKTAAYAVWPVSGGP
jgi:hypothetical protein